MSTPAKQSDKIFFDDNTWFLINYNVFGDNLVNKISYPGNACINKVSSCCKVILCNSTNSSSNSSVSGSKMINRSSAFCSVSTSRAQALVSDECLKISAKTEFPKKPGGGLEQIPIVHQETDWMIDSDSDSDN